MFRRIWENIKQAIRSLTKQSDIDLFIQTATNVSLGEVGGTVTDINSTEIFLQITPENVAVNNMFDKLIEVDGDMILLDVGDIAPDGSVVEKRHYRYKGVIIDQTVTEKLNKHKDFKFVEDAPWKMKWGSEGHAYLELYIKNNLLDAQGFVKKKTSTPISTTLNRDVRVALQIFAQELVSNYPKGTRFLTEVKVVNESVKGGLASTVDFMALVPEKLKNGKDNVKIDILDWKFTSFNDNKYEDLSPGKQKSWKMQMGEYVKMMTTPLYKQNRNNIRKARMIPFIAKYVYNISGVRNSGLFLKEIEVGDINDPKNTKVHLLPVPVDTESTGNSKVDQLVSGLAKQHIKIFKKLRSPKEKFEKTAELTAITQAIKKLRVQLDFDPLYNVGLDLNNRISKNLKAFEKLDFSEMTNEQINIKLGELLEFQTSLEKFTNLSVVYADYLGRDSDALTKEEKMTKRKIERVSIDALALDKEISALQRKYVTEQLVKTGIVLEENADDALIPEIPIKWISSKFLEGSRLGARVIKLGTKMILDAKKLVDVKTKNKIKEFSSILLDLEEHARGLGVKSFSLIGAVKDNDLQLINKIKKDYYKERRIASENGDKAFFKQNMNITAYKQQVSKILKEQYKIIDQTVYTENKTRNTERQKIAKASLKNKIDIFSKDFYGINEPYFLYIFNQNFKEENHYSEEFKQLKNNEVAYKVWKFFMELNKEARDLGYLSQEKTSFFPLIEATSLQKLQQTKDYGSQGIDFFKDVFMSRINETLEYNTIDPETGEIKKSIPKYFTKTDKNVEQLSRDLNLVGALWINSIEKYKSSKNLENALNTMHIVEKSKGSIKQDGGKTVYDGSNIVISEENPNAKVFEEIKDDALYGKRESATAEGNMVIDIGAAKLSKTEEEAEKKGVDVRKSINSANNLVRLLALGGKYALGIANYFGTQLQTFIKSGEFYTFAEYEKNHSKVMFSNLGTLTTEELGMLDMFIPLNEDMTLVERLNITEMEQYLKYLSTWSFTDVLMLTMQFPEKKLQFANGLSFLENTIVMNGELVNIRQYLQEQDRKNRKSLSVSERKILRKGLNGGLLDSTGTRVKELQESDKALKNVIKITDQGATIPGITDEQIAKYRVKIIDYNRTLNGMMDENDKMGFRRDTLFSSFMMFKSWIPKLVYVRTGALDKNIQTGNWEYGRMRAFVKTWLYKDLEGLNIEDASTKAFYTRWNMSVMSSVRNINDIIKMNDRGMEITNKILYDKKMKHFKDTGQQLEITEEEFQDIMRDAVINQFKEIGVLFTVMGSYFGAVIAEPPEDATPLELNRYKSFFRQINKIADEITFYYNPTSTEAILQGTFIPAFGLLSKINRFGNQLGHEIYGNMTGDLKMMEDAHPTKYLINLFPVLSQAQNEYLPLFDAELAKSLGVRVTKESRR